MNRIPKSLLFSSFPCYSTRLLLYIIAWFALLARGIEFGYRGVHRLNSKVDVLLGDAHRGLDAEDLERKKEVQSKTPGE